MFYTKRRIEHPRSGVWSGLVWDWVLQFYQLCFYVWIMPFCKFLQFMSGVDKIIQCTPGYTDTVSSELLSEDERTWRQKFLICSSKEILSNNHKRSYRDSTEVKFLLNCTLSEVDFTGNSQKYCHFLLHKNTSVKQISRSDCKKKFSKRAG